MLRCPTIGHQVQTAASEEGGIHLLERDDLFQDQGFVPRLPELLQFLGLNDDMVTGRVFVPTGGDCGSLGPPALWAS
jgi:hypothetical protein